MHSRISVLETEVATKFSRGGAGYFSCLLALPHRPVSSRVKKKAMSDFSTLSVSMHCFLPEG